MTGKLEAVDRVALARWARAGLVVSILFLGAAPMMVAESYSVAHNTLSESGAQGVDGAWVLRVGILLTAGSVLLLSVAAGSRWLPRVKWWIRIYATALILLAAFSEAPWDGSPHDEMVASLHTVFGIAGAIAFIVGAAALATSRPRAERLARGFDWLVIAVIALIPQVMHLSELDGLLQRTMVILGYLWLLVEASRLARGDLGAPSLRRTSEVSSERQP